MPDPLVPFLTGQSLLYDRALAELRGGRLRSDWTGLIFPQLEGLAADIGNAEPTLKSPTEVRAFLDHPLLGRRLAVCVATLQGLVYMTAAEILGPEGAERLHISLTAFAAIGHRPLYSVALQRWFGMAHPGAIRWIEEASRR